MASLLIMARSQAEMKFGGHPQEAGIQPSQHSGLKKMSVRMITLQTAVMDKFKAALSKYATQGTSHHDREDPIL